MTHTRIMLTFLAALGMLPGDAVASPATDLAALARDYWELQVATGPTLATYVGDHRFDDRLEDISPGARREKTRKLQVLRHRLRNIEAGSLEATDRVTRDILAELLDLAIEEPRHALHELALDQMSGPQVWFFELLNYHPHATVKDLENLASRYEAFPRHMQQYIEGLRAGMGSGRTCVTLVVDRVLAQLDDLAGKGPAKGPLWASLAWVGGDAKAPDASWAKVKPATRDQLKARLEAGITKSVWPALEGFRTFLRDEYQSRARTTVGINSIPGGEVAYRFLIQKHTSTRMDPKEIHQIGLSEVDHWSTVMLDVARKLGHKGDLPSFLKSLGSRKELFASSREDLMERYKKALVRATACLPRFFGRVPQAPCIVKAIEDFREKDSVAAFYYPPPEDGSRPAVYYANLYDPPSRPLFNVTPLTVHEAVPGHHLQIGVAQETKDLPMFRRHADFTVLVEGWALYAELLADEMGLYDDDLSRLGMATYQNWRACRLVVDTGMHSMGWTRDQALTFMRDHLALTEKEIVNEVDRYIIWPGQALAYKLGQREILALRAACKDALGSRFDIKAFHDALLACGPAPMHVVAGHVKRALGL